MRRFHGVSAADGRLYVTGGVVPAGGGHSGGKISASMIVYDPERDTWQSVASMSGPRHALRLVEADGYLYAIGRWDMMSPMLESRVRPSVVHITIDARRLLVVVAGVEFGRNGKIINGRRTSEIFDLDTSNWELLDALEGRRFSPMSSPS